MNKEIKDIVLELRISELRKELELNRERIFKIERQMSKMAFDRNIGLYAYYLNEIYDIALSLPTKSRERDQELYKRMDELDTIIKELEKYPGAKEYGELKREYYQLLFNSDYYKRINIDLRKALTDNMILPEIYVEQHHFDYDKHIINKTPLLSENENNSTIICPLYDIDSFRNYRHFYNKTSFKYLEELTKDCSFDLDEKKLGKCFVRKIK